MYQFYSFVLFWNTCVEPKDQTIRLHITSLRNRNIIGLWAGKAVIVYIHAWANKLRAHLYWTRMKYIIL